MSTVSSGRSNAQRSEGECQLVIDYYEVLHGYPKGLDKADSSKSTEVHESTRLGQDDPQPVHLNFSQARTSSSPAEAPSMLPSEVVNASKANVVASASVGRPRSPQSHHNCSVHGNEKIIVERQHRANQCESCTFTLTHQWANDTIPRVSHER